MAAVEAELIRHGNKPSPQTLAALRDIPKTALDILAGKAPPAIYVSPLDVGMGKTTTLKHTIKAIRAAYPEAGIVSCLGRHEQIEAMVADLELPENEYAVLVHKDAQASNGKLFSEMGLGANRIDQAPVLLTTHAQVENRCQEGTWAEQKAFWYRDKPRPLRAWDEALDMRRPLSITKEQLHRIMSERNAPRALKEYIEAVLGQVKSAENRQLIDLPEIAEPLDALSILDDLPADSYKAVSQPLREVLALSGKRQALVVKHGEDNVLIQYVRKLPPDILPVLVLDASAMDRWAFLHQPEEIVTLRRAEKRYERVVVNVQNGPSGKTEFWKPQNFDDRMDVCASNIRSHPDRNALVLHPKEKTKEQHGKIAEALRKRLSEKELTRVKLLHWGAHTAVNDYADCSLIIALTLYHLPSFAYEGIGRAAREWPIDKDYDAMFVKATELGEVLSNFRQGVGRGALRKVDGNQAHECIIYTQAPTKKDIKDGLKRLFPGCKVANGEGKLDGQERLIAFLNEQPGDTVPYPTVYQALGISPGNFTNLIKRTKAPLELEGWGIVKARPCRFVRKET